jgi:hypothetical protein
MLRRTAKTPPAMMARFTGPGMTSSQSPGPGRRRARAAPGPQSVSVTVSESESGAAGPRTLRLAAPGREPAAAAGRPGGPVRPWQAAADARESNDVKLALWRDSEPECRTMSP